MNPDFLDLLRSLVAADARFLVVGAYALAVHGRPRATGDLDVWVEPSDENAPRVLEALSRFGAPLDEISAADFRAPDTVFQVGVPPRRIDVMTSITGVRFEDAFPHRVIASFGGVEFPVLGRAEFRTNKRAVGRPKDLADLDALDG